MAWWIWVLGGLVLLAGRSRSRPGASSSIFFGAGAILVGALKARRLGRARLGGVAGLHGALGRLARALPRAADAPLQPDERASPSTSSQGERALVTEDVAPGGVGKAEMRGASWTARTSGTVALARGQRCLRRARRGADALAAGPSEAEGDLHDGCVRRLRLSGAVRLLSHRADRGRGPAAARLRGRAARALRRRRSTPASTSWCPSWT